jgi:hypothetical protein
MPWAIGKGLSCNEAWGCRSSTFSKYRPRGTPSLPCALLLMIRGGRKSALWSLSGIDHPWRIVFRHAWAIFRSSSRGLTSAHVLMVSRMHLLAWCGSFVKMTIVQIKIPPTGVGGNFLWQHDAEQFLVSRATYVTSKEATRLIWLSLRRCNRWESHRVQSVTNDRLVTRLCKPEDSFPTADVHVSAFYPNDLAAALLRLDRIIALKVCPMPGRLRAPATTCVRVHMCSAEPLQPWQLHRRG